MSHYTLESHQGSSLGLPLLLLSVVYLQCKVLLRNHNPLRIVEIAYLLSPFDNPSLLHPLPSSCYRLQSHLEHHQKLQMLDQAERIIHLGSLIRKLDRFDNGNRKAIILRYLLQSFPHFLK